ncbi:MAG: hypothetical protein JXA71_20445 [Chitinispirillaceae bacterium]|nr:hypothetical protein [Chitinispirillaceae bacterium]
MVLIIGTAALFIKCGVPDAMQETGGTLLFDVIDVGQGLSQVAVWRDTALFFDFGPREAAASLQEEYACLGRPFIAAIAISHDHADHFGGLSTIDTSFNWSGRVMVTPYGDTALMRQSLTAWSGPLTFTRIAEGDSITLLSGITVRCLWPPSGVDSAVAATEEAKNRYSAVFKINHHEVAVLITADIDSVACRELSTRQKTAIFSPLLVVPHHGSASSLCPLFLGYVRPVMAIISCAENNPYGHPSEAVMLWLAQMGTQTAVTYRRGTISLRSNGYYWQ